MRQSTLCIDLAECFCLRLLRVDDCFSSSMGLCSPDLSVDRATLTGNYPRSMSFPVCPQATSEHSCGLDKLLLFLYPWRDDLLFLDDLIHEVLGGVKKGATGCVISLNVRAFATRDILELTSSDCVLDTFVSQRRQTLN